MTVPSAVEVIAHIQNSDIVFLDWPDGTATLVKGQALLERIAVDETSEQLRICRLPVSCTAEAEVIAAAIQVMEEGKFHPGAEATFCRLLAETRGGEKREAITVHAVM